MIRSEGLNKKVQDMAAIYEDMAKFSLVLKGEFDAELKAMRELSKRLAEQQGTIDTAAKAAKVKADADAYAAACTREAQGLKAQAQEVLDKANAKMATVYAREQAVANREAQAARQEAEIAAKKREAEQESQAAAARLSVREAAINRAEEDIGKARTTLEREQQTWKQKLAILQT